MLLKRNRSSVPDPGTPTDLGFLHTAQLHVPAFEQLMRDMDGSLRATHHVRDELLAHATAHGTSNGAFRKQVHEAVRELQRASGASVIVCTCSTLGAIAEQANLPDGCTVVRVDRAMAEEAARLGPRALVVATLESTVEPTLDLLAESALRLKRPLDMRSVVVPGCWAWFEQGNHHRYATAIAQAVRTHLADATVVVLAQASMAPAAALLGQMPVRVLASPSLGVAQAIRQLHRLRQDAGRA